MHYCIIKHYLIFQYSFSRLYDESVKCVASKLCFLHRRIFGSFNIYLFFLTKCFNPSKTLKIYNSFLIFSVIFFLSGMGFIDNSALKMDNLVILFNEKGCSFWNDRSCFIHQTVTQKGGSKIKVKELVLDSCQ